MTTETLDRPRSRGIYVLTSAVGISSLGLSMTFIALPLFVVQMHGNTGKTAILISLAAVSSGLGGLFAGPLVDKWGFKRTAMVSHLFGACAAASIPFAALTGLLSFPALCLLIVCASLLDVPGGVAITGLVPKLAAAAKMPLERGNAMLGGVRQMSMLLGPPLGGLGVALSGSNGVLMFDAIASIVAGTLIAVGVRIAVGRPAVKTSTGTYFRDMTEGLSLAFRNKLIRTLTISSFTFGGLEVALSGVVLLTYAFEHLDSKIAFSMLLVSFGVGLVIGTIVFGLIGHRYNRRRAYLSSCFSVGLLILPLAFLPPLPIAMVLLLVLGAAAAPAEPLFVGAMQRNVPQEVFGRVMTSTGTLAIASTPAGALLAMVMIEDLGLRTAILMIGSAYLTVTVRLWATPQLKAM
jgi:MFS family permease